ncbi:MAG TPA: hypothetical protein PK855_10675 [Bacteroidales bacterium]|nr:hypothetical protein [Bacteroidales bacterium]
MNARQSIIHAVIMLWIIVMPAGLFAQSKGKNLNDDNAVLLPGKKFLFKETICTPDTQAVHYIILSVEPLPLYRQTLIRYTYYHSIDSLQKGIVYTWEETLADDNRRWYQIHPPRAGLNIIHELLPFPEIPLRKKTGHQWKSTIIVMDGWEKIPKNTRIVSRYQLGADTAVMIGGKKQIGRLVRARSQSKFGTGNAGFIFVDGLGFVEIENEINGITTRMRLIEMM